MSKFRTALYVAFSTKNKHFTWIIINFFCIEFWYLQHMLDLMGKNEHQEQITKWIFGGNFSDEKQLHRERWNNDTYWQTISLNLLYGKQIYFNLN
jgi:hypothetical protein